ncbi:tetratricopeptide repeat protein [Streptomyces sp. NPDC096132]|uniref:tetratricopeptide repeat protein n=1 Tax=Streptomyces sp. NPDC096132 TaxID=3366075 RepID=UPI0038175620
MLVGLPDIDLLLGRGTLHLYTDRLPRARADFERAVDLARTGPVPLRVIALTLLAKTEFLAGDWDLAETHWETASSVAADLGQGWIAPVVHAEAAHLRTARGAWDQAAAHLRTAHGNPVVRESRMLEIFVTYGRAFLDHMRGDPTAALALLRPLLAHDGLDFTAETANVPWRDLLADCLVAAGELDESERLLTALEERAARRAAAPPSPPSSAPGARCTRPAANPNAPRTPTPRPEPYACARCPLRASSVPLSRMKENRAAGLDHSFSWKWPLTTEGPTVGIAVPSEMSRTTSVTVYEASLPCSVRPTLGRTRNARESPTPRTSGTPWGKSPGLGRVPGGRCAGVLADL